MTTHFYHFQTAEHLTTGYLLTFSCFKHFEPMQPCAVQLFTKQELHNERRIPA